MKEIFWRIFVETKERRKAKNSLGAIQELLSNSELKTFAPYWKDKNLFEIELIQSLDSTLPQYVLSEVLEYVAKISSTWNIDLAYDIETREIDLSGISEKISLKGITWASFTIQEKSSED